MTADDRSASGASSQMRIPLLAVQELADKVEWRRRDLIELISMGLAARSRSARPEHRTAAMDLLARYLTDWTVWDNAVKRRALDLPSHLDAGARDES